MEIATCMYMVSSFPCSFVYFYGNRILSVLPIFSLSCFLLCIYFRIGHKIGMTSLNVFDIFSQREVERMKQTVQEDCSTRFQEGSTSRYVLSYNFF